MKRIITTFPGTGAIALAVLITAVARAQSAPTLPPGMDANNPLGHVIQMLQSGTAETAILVYISSSAVPFNISAAELVYLNDLGTPSDIETAMSRRDQELGLSARAQAQPPPPGQSQEPQDITGDYFYGALAPYGSWVNIPGYGLCWQPYAATYNSSWAPYCTLGQWLYTDCGWYWLSDYSWGWCVFHYGRWFHDAQRGWCWWPATKWAPSWVFWRYSANYCGWAPLPPHCYYSQGNGLLYNGVVVASDYDFGVGANLFNFVSMPNLFDSNIGRYRLTAAQSSQIFTQSKVLCAINSNDRTIVNDGIPVYNIAAATHWVMHSLTIQPVESVALPGAPGEQILPNGETLVVDRPYFNTDVPLALRQGIYPVPAQEQPVPHQPPSYIVNENPLIQPPENDDNNSVIYVDSPARNAPPMPTVIVASPVECAAPPPGESYWTVSAEATEPIDTASEYMSPRLRSHDRWQHHARQAADHQEFNPHSSRAHTPEQQQSHDSHPPEHSPGHSSLPNGPGQAAPPSHGH